MEGLEAFSGVLLANPSLVGTLSVPLSAVDNAAIYEGPYKVIPTDITQVLSTSNKILMHDIIVDKVSNETLTGSELATDADIEEMISKVFNSK